MPHTTSSAAAHLAVVHLSFSLLFRSAEKLLHRREASVSNFAPCMLLYTEGSEPGVKETKLYSSHFLLYLSRSLLSFLLDV